jgi:hypothetical protein
MSVPQHIVERLEDYLDGQLDQAGQDVLLAWAQESDANAKNLAEWFSAEVNLFEASRVADMCAMFEGVPFDVRADQLEPQSALARRSPWMSQRGFLAAAAVLLLAITAALFFFGPSAKSGRNRPIANRAVATSSKRAADIAPLPSPAILGRLGDCIWAPGMQPLRVGQDIDAGTFIEIQSGLAQLVFECGAEVVLRGPCRMRIDDSMLCSLAYGSVSAEVPPRAAGFTIRGPAAEVIDLGTRFGFSVGKAGESEVHVFQGEVISRQLDKQGEVIGDEILLTTNQAIHYPGEKQQAKRMAADEAKFSLEVRPLWRQDAIEPLAVDRNVALWLRAAHGVQLDPKQRVVAWQDLAIGDNLIAHDAFQPIAKARPKFALSAIGGGPALRFDGHATFLTTTPITTTDDQTIVIVFQYAAPHAGEKRHTGQIVNYNGPPSRYLPDVYSPGVLQMGEKIDGRNGPFLSIAAKAFVGRDSRSGDVSTGVVVSESLSSAQPHVALYTYSLSKGAALLYVDGEQVAQASAPTRVAVTSRKVIGKHGIFDQWYFRGDLAELVIFNAALSPNEVASVSQNMMKHYNIPATR